MALKISIREVVETLQFLSEEGTASVHRETGELRVHDGWNPDIGDEELSEDSTVWEDEALNGAGAPGDSAKWISLPAKFEIDEYEMLRDFSQSYADPVIRAELLNAIDGRGAFRMFKSVVYTRGIEKKWFAFRDLAYRDIVVEWCEAHGIAYEDDVAEAPSADVEVPRASVAPSETVANAAPAELPACRRCGRPIGEKDVRYVVDVRVFAAPDPLTIDEDDWKRDHEKAMREAIERSSRLTDKQLMNDVYAAFQFDLCHPCQQAYLQNPVPKKKRRFRR